MKRGARRYPWTRARVWAGALAWMILLIPTGLHGQSPEEFSARPAPVAAAISGVDPAPAVGFFFGAGFRRAAIESEAFGLKSDPSPPFGDGADVQIGWQWQGFRLEYIRQTLRRTPPSGFTWQGETVTQFGYDANQLWITHGFRPWRPLRLGYGVGYQRRVVLLAAAKDHRFRESGGIVGLMADYAFAPPFVLHFRWEREQAMEYLQVNAQTLYIAYIVPF